MGAIQAQSLLLRALRFNLLHGAAPLVSLQRSRVIPKDYQLVPVVMALDMPRVRLLLADDVGLGKTIEAGLIVTELLDRIRDESFYGQSEVSLPEVESRLAETAATIGSPEEIRSFVVSGLSRFGCRVAETGRAVPSYRIAIHDPRLRGAGIPDAIDAATFDPEAALDDPDLTLIDLGHPLVRRLIELVRLELFRAGSEQYGRSAYGASPAVDQVTAVLHVLARYVVASEPPNIVEEMIPLALALDGDLLGWGEAARALQEAPVTGERVPLADVQEDLAALLGRPALHEALAGVVEARRAALAAERRELRRRVEGPDTAGGRWLRGIDQIEIGSFDLLTVTLYYPSH